MDEQAKRFMNHQIFLGKYATASAPDGIASPGRPSRFGMIYHAVATESERPVAVEVLPATSLTEAVRAQLEAEAAAAKELNHPNIPALYDFGFEGENLIYVTEEVDGTTLEEWVSEHGPLETGAALRVGLQILSALGAAAYHRILHHAINPKNVLIVPGTATDGGWPLVKLLNLIGLAPGAGNASAIDGVSDNSASFASPEQLQTGAVDFRSEIYSLGGTLYYALTGEIPFQNVGETPDARVAATQRTIERLRDLPKDARRLLSQMLSSNPDERPLDPLATHNLLQTSLAEVERNPVRAAADTLIAPPITGLADIPNARRFPANILAIAALLLVVAAVAALVMPSLLRRTGVTRTKAADGEIGVPVGIPERSATPVVATRSTPEPQVAQSSPVLASSSVAEKSSAAEAPTLTSVDPDQVAAAASTVPIVQAQQPAVEASPPEVAAAAPTPMDSATVAEEARPTPIANASSDSTPAVRERKSFAETEPAATPSQRADSTPVRVRKAQPVTDADLARVPRGAVGARYLGTNEKGEWIFGLPEQRQGVAKLPKTSETAAQGRARRRVRRAEPVEEEPVYEPVPRALRTLPPDE